MFYLFCNVMQLIYIAVCCSSDDPTIYTSFAHDDVIKWKHFPRCWPLVRGIPGEFPTKRPVTRSFDVYFNVRPNKRLSKQSWGWWFETPSHPFCVIVMLCGNFTKYCHKRKPFVFESANVTFITTVTVNMDRHALNYFRSGITDKCGISDGCFYEQHICETTSIFKLYWTTEQIDYFSVFWGQTTAEIYDISFT